MNDERRTTTMTMTEWCKHTYIHARSRLHIHMIAGQSICPANRPSIPGGVEASTSTYCPLLSLVSSLLPLSPSLPLTRARYGRAATLYPSRGILNQPSPVQPGLGPRSVCRGRDSFPLVPGTRNEQSRWLDVCGAGSSRRSHRQAGHAGSGTLALSSARAQSHLHLRIRAT